MLAAVLLAASAFGDCLPEDITIAPALYRVAGEGRLPFYRTADCRDVSCREGAYIIPGDAVVAFGQAAGRSCALFQRATETIGWVDSDRLRRVDGADHPAPTAWMGEWYDGDDRIRLGRAVGGHLRISGDAYWPSRNPGKDRPFGPNIGSLDGRAAVDGNRAAYDDGSGEFACKVTLRLLGEILLVNDNGNCGGHNVRFSGVYRRRTRS